MLTSMRRLKRRRVGTTLAPRDKDLDRGRVVQFFRDFHLFSGGHLKVWDYFEHVASSSEFVPVIRFTPDSVFDGTNPWRRSSLVDVGSRPIEPGVLFVAGMDWTVVPDARRSPIPVINLVQHVRHADPNEELYSFLTNRAVRICGDPAIEEALRATGKANGPLLTIQIATDLECFTDDVERDIDVLIVAIKQPEIGRSIDAALPDYRRTLLTEPVRRDDFVRLLRRAKVTVCLPNATEGAYLPPLEAMASGSIAICPEHIGNSYSRDAVNAFRPAYTVEAIAAATIAALSAEHSALIDAGFRTVRDLSLASERRRFLDVLEKVDDLYA